MSLDNINVVDAVGTEISTGCVVLSIIDAWDWIDEAKHLDKLHQKINCYVDFIKSGQLEEEYPTARDCSVRIEVVGKFPLQPVGEQFLASAPSKVSQGVAVTFRHVPQ